MAARATDGLRALSGRLRPWLSPDADGAFALARIGVALALLLSYVQIIGDYANTLGTFAYIPRADWPATMPERSLSYFRWVTSEPLAAAIAVAGVAPMLSLLVGYRTQISAALAWYLLVSAHDRAAVLLDGGDIALRLALMAFIASPADRALAVRQRPRVAGSDSFGIRVLQVQLCVVYLCSGLEKLQGATWRNGTALGYVLQLESFSRGASTWFAQSGLFVNAATWGTLAFELLFPVLVWVPRCRRTMLVAGIGLHLGVECLMYVPIFSWIMMAHYAAFLTRDETERLTAYATRLLSRLRETRARPAAR